MPFQWFQSDVFAAFGLHTSDAWMKSAMYTGILCCGAWQLQRYLRRAAEFSQIACTEPSLMFMGGVFLRTRGDLGKTLVALVRKYGPAPLKLSFFGHNIGIAIASSPGMYELAPLPKGKWYAMLNVLFGAKSLITLNHDEHRRHRRLLSHGFTMSSLHGFLPAFERHAKNLVNAWRDLRTIDLHQWMMRLTFDIIADQAFGYDSKCIEGSVEGNRFATSACKIAKMVMYHWLHVPGLAQLWRLLNYRTFSFVDQKIYTCIAQRKEERSRREESATDSDSSSRRGLPKASARDVLDLMLDTGEFTDLELRDEAFIFYLAGHETTAVTLTWLFLHLSADMHLQERVREEVQRVVGSGPLTKETERRLPLVQNLLRETLRLYPPAFAFTRSAEQAVEMDGARIPAGYDIFINVLGMQRDPKVFSDPDVFNVDRWSSNPEGLGPDGRKYYSPFSFGPRQCIGMNFAWLEMQSVVCEVLRTYEMRLEGAVPDWTTLPITTSPCRPVQIQLKLLGRPD